MICSRLERGRTRASFCTLGTTRTLLGKPERRSDEVDQWSPHESRQPQRYLCFAPNLGWACRPFLTSPLIPQSPDSPPLGQCSHMQTENSLRAQVHAYSLLQMKKKKKKRIQLNQVSFFASRFQHLFWVNQRIRESNFLLFQKCNLKA